MSDERGSSQDPSQPPEPHTDAAPDTAPGGPADRVTRDEDDFPLATPDQPRSAQVEDAHVPDEIEESEEMDEEEKELDPGDEPSA